MQVDHKSSLFSPAPFLKTKQICFSSRGDIHKILSGGGPDKPSVNRVDLNFVSHWWPHSIPLAELRKSPK